MNDLLEKLNKVKNQILQEKGSLLFFALFSRNDSKKEYDLIISASWVKDGETRNAVKYLFEKIKENDVILEGFVSNMAAFSPNEHFVHHIASAFKNNRITHNSKTDVSIKLFDDYIINAIVLKQDFDDFEISTLKESARSEFTPAF